MPTLIDRSGARPDVWAVLADDTPLSAAPAAPAAVIVSPARWESDAAGLRAEARPLGIALAPDDDPDRIADALPALALVTVFFPTFTDGRGYSIARLLRERHGWRGELRAIGDIQRDQLFYLARCGFDSFLLKDGESVERALSGFRDFREAYQSAVDRGPLFLRRATSPAQVAAGRSPG